MTQAIVASFFHFHFSRLSEKNTFNYRVLWFAGKIPQDDAIFSQKETSRQMAFEWLVYAQRIPPRRTLLKKASFLMALKVALRDYRHSYLVYAFFSCFFNDLAQR